MGCTAALKRLILRDSRGCWQNGGSEGPGHGLEDSQKEVIDDGVSQWRGDVMNIQSNGLLEKCCPIPC